MTVIRNILASQDTSPSKQDIMFLEAKMIHGAFREKGMIEEYDLFIRITRSGIVNNRAVEKYPKLHAANPPVSPVRIFAGGSPCGLKLFTRMVL